MDPRPQIIEGDQCTFCVNHSDIKLVFWEKIDMWVPACVSCLNSMMNHDLDDFWD